MAGVTASILAYAAPGMLASGGIHPSQQGRRVFAQEVAELTGRALHWMGWGRRTVPGLSLANWDEMQRSEGQGAGKGPLPLSAVLATLGHPAVLWR